MRRRILVLLLTAVCVAVCQSPQSPQAAPPSAPTQVTAVPAASGVPAENILRVGDQLLISANDVPGMSEKPYRIEPDGSILLPLVGRVRAEGLTVERFQEELISQLKIYLKSPQVFVKLALTETGAVSGGDTIVVAGAFKNPGVHPLPGRRGLLYVVSDVGGLLPNAMTVKITRRLENGPIPLPSAVEDLAARVTTATINFNHLIGNPGAVDNLTVEPNDILTAESAGAVFLTGEVFRPGAVTLTDRDSIGMTELISQAGGLSRDAAPEKAKILREILNGSKRAEIAVDVRSILDGHSFDFPVQSNDVVVIPRRGGTGSALKSVLLYIVPVGVSAAMYAVLR